MKDVGHLLPGQPFGPSGQKPCVAGRQPVFALRPRNRLDLDAADRAIDPTHGIEKKHRDSPQRHKFESTAGERIVTGPFLPAARADRLGVGSRSDFDFNNRSIHIFGKPTGAVNKICVLFNPIQYSLNQHSVSSLLAVFFGENTLPEKETECFLFSNQFYSEQQSIGTASSG
jgi:hypothetical protein